MLSLGAGVTRTCGGPTRRDFLRVGGLSTLGLALTELNPWASAAAAAATSAGGERSVILLMLVGGPSQLETWDPKPDAPEEIRGPFGSIATAVPGVRISEHLPLMTRRMDRVTLIRSLHHDAAPIHETGHQLLQTGQLCRDGAEAPHLGSVVARLRGSRNDLPPFVVLPRPIGNTGVGIPHGQSAGRLGSAYEPFHIAADPAAPDYDARNLFDRAQRFLDETADPVPAPLLATAGRVLSRPARGAFDLGAERAAVRDAYGRGTFGQSCLLARRLVEAGVRVVTVNMFETVFNQVTWDCHGMRPFSTLDDYARDLLPTLDRALSALLDDLDRRGLLDTTLVVATGEFGRTPRLNYSGGRDHWPGVWSAVLAGGGTRGGQVIGASDCHAGSPADRPVTAPELVATMYHSLGIDPSAGITRADGSPAPVIEAIEPIAEVLA
jgi:uncharacterized protein (DUF1501 family)